MTAKFLEEPWPRITKAVRKNPKSCQIAVAYLGSEASRILPMRTGSRLVIDFSEEAIKSGKTNPKEVLKLLRKGVEVHSAEELHAKVFVIGRSAFVGSMNASSHSRNRLFEAALQTEDRRVVGSCRRFIRKLCGEIVTPEFARKMVKLYPKDARRGNKRKSKIKVVGHSRLWAVPLITASWDNRDKEECKKGEPIAQKRLRDSEQYWVDKFQWERSRFPKMLKRGDLLLQLIKDDKKHFVCQAERFLHLRNYKKSNSRSIYSIIYLEKRKNARRRDRQKVISRLGYWPTVLRQLKIEPRLLRNKKLVHELLNIGLIERKERV